MMIKKLSMLAAAATLSVASVGAMAQVMVERLIKRLDTPALPPGEFLFPPTLNTCA